MALQSDRSVAGCKPGGARSRQSARRGTLADMTTEDDFNAALDAKPEDWQTRLVYADWLQERGDPRAEGYRALGVLRLRPKREGEGEGGTWAYQGGVADDYPACHTLPRDWFDADSPGNTYWTHDLDTR